MEPYRYTESGLDNVMIEGLKPVTDDDGDAEYCIENVRGLHRAIAENIVGHNKGISGRELRFLRTEMGMTQAEMAKLVHCDAQTIGRWERGEYEIENKAEALIRLRAIEKFDLRVEGGVEELSARCVPTSMTQPILIDGRDPSEYRPMAA